METQDDMDIVMKVEVEDDPLMLPGDTEQESINSKKIEDDINKIQDYIKAKEKEYDEQVKDNREKMVVAQNIIKACKEYEPRNLTPIQKVHHYTKLPFSELVGVFPEGVTNKSLIKAIEDTRKIPSHVNTFIYNDIRDVFIEHYVRRRQLPSVELLKESLCQKRDNTFYKNMNITTLVKNKLVKYHYLPHLNSYILTENPEFSYQRHLYLKQVMRYRKEKSFVYVAALNIKMTSDRVKYVLLAASANDLITNFSQKHLFVVDQVTTIEHQIKLWIRSELIPKISTNSIVVLSQPRKEDPTPTPYSSKAEMVNWLSTRFVPHDPDSHKSQLYSLIKKSKKNFRVLGFYEEVLASAGFTVLVCPIEYENLDFFSTIQTHAIQNSMELVHTVTSVLPQEWRHMEKELVEEEKQILKDDQEMDRIIENLFQMVKNDDLKVEDFPFTCRATKADNFAVHIGDIVVD